MDGFNPCPTALQLDQTKTSDGKSNFLNVLVNAVAGTYPDALHVANDLPSVADASRGNKFTTYKQWRRLHTAHGHMPQNGWRRGSVVRTSVLGWWTFPDVRQIYG